MQYIACFQKKSLYYFENAEDNCFDKNYEEVDFLNAINTINEVIRNWCEGMDLISADTKRPTKYLKIFKMLYYENNKLTYKEISQKVGGANVEKFVYKCNMIAIGKAKKLSKEDEVYRHLLNKYYSWIDDLMVK